MGEDRIEKARLTRQQLACIAKVAEHKDSLQIAYELGIAKSTVDIHIAKAVAKLGVGGRREAAKLLLERHIGNTDRISSDFFGIVTAPHCAADISISEQNGSLLRDGSDVGFSPPYRPEPMSLSPGDDAIDRYDLSAFKVIGLTLLLVLALSLVVIASIPMSTALQDMVDLWCRRFDNRPPATPRGQRRSTCSRNVLKPPETSLQPCDLSNRQATISLR